MRAWRSVVGEFLQRVRSAAPVKSRPSPVFIVLGKTNSLTGDSDARSGDSDARSDDPDARSDDREARSDAPSREPPRVPPGGAFGSPDSSF